MMPPPGGEVSHDDRLADIIIIIITCRPISFGCIEVAGAIRQATTTELVASWMRKDGEESEGWEGGE